MISVFEPFQKKKDILAGDISKPFFVSEILKRIPRTFFFLLFKPTLQIWDSNILF